MDFPDGITTEQLEQLIKSAPDDSTDDDGISKEDVINSVLELRDILCEKYPHPIIHKTLALGIIATLVKWHKAAAIDSSTEGHEKDLPFDLGIALQWASDMGKLETAHDILRSVKLGRSDFTTEMMDYDD